MKLSRIARIALGLLFAFPDFSGGELGISGLRRLAVTPAANYYIAVVSMLAIVFALWLLADSKFGLVLHAIRDDEVAARASGINTPRYKLIVFAVSAAAAGFAGALFAHYLRVAGPSTLEVALSFQVVIWPISSTNTSASESAAHGSVVVTLTFSVIAPASSAVYDPAASLQSAMTTTPPPGAFLQPTAEGEETLARLTLEALARLSQS